MHARRRIEGRHMHQAKNTQVTGTTRPCPTTAPEHGATPIPECCPIASADNPFRPRWMDIDDPTERQCAHIVDTLGFCGHYIHVNGSGRSGRAPIICALYKRGGEMGQRDLMGMFELKAGSLSEILAKIEREGLIERTRDPQDRRQLIVRLTPNGREVAEREQAKREDFRANALACLTAAERDGLESTLARIKQHWLQLQQDKGDCQ